MKSKTQTTCIGQEKKYYELCNLLSKGHMMNFVVGSRFGGKSTAVQKYTIKRVIRSLKKNRMKACFNQFVLAVQWGVDKKKRAASYFTNTMDQFYPDYEMIYEAGNFYIRRRRENQDDRKADKILCGYCIAISEASKYKSSSYPYVNTIILEEFINIERHYIVNKDNPTLEAEMLVSLAQTIFRGNGKQFREDGKVIAISNAYNLDNPYLQYYGIVGEIEKDPFKTIYEQKKPIYNSEGDCVKPDYVLEMLDNDVPVGINAGSTAMGSKFEDFRNEIHIIENTPKKTNKVGLQMSFNGRDWLNVTQFQGKTLVFKHKDKKLIDNILHYSCSRLKKADVYDIYSFRRTPAYKHLENLYHKNELAYDSYETYIAVYNILSF